MSNEEIKSLISSLVPETVLEDGKQFLSVTVNPDNLFFLAKHLKENLGFNYLFCLTGVDWMKHFTLIYHLSSTEKKYSLVLKTNISERENPTANSVSSLWRTAEFHEREIYDLFGIKFNNHPDLRRILLDDDWKGFPLRKDYTDEINIVELE